MKKFVSIVIPRYKETEKDIFPLLSSINGQVGVDLSDIEAIIANDGKNETAPLDGTFLSLFDFDIRQVTCEVNRGCGPARQAGIDIARGEYVICCDADDTLHSVGVLGAMMQEAEKNAPDMLITSWLEEVIDAKGAYQYITHENDNTWMHGKLYRRQFLIQNNIRFPDCLRVQEDSYFNNLASAFAERRQHLPVTSYVWKYSPDSTTRKNNGIYAYQSIPEFIRSCSMAYAEIERRAPQQLEYKILQFILYNYFSFHHPEWQNPKRSAYLKAAEDAFVTNVTPYLHYWNDAPKQTIADIYSQERNRSFTGYMEEETVSEWLKRLGLKG